MKRQLILLSTAVALATLMPVVGRAQVAPCPPPALQVEGGSSATSTCAPSETVAGDIFTASYASDIGNWDTETGEDRHTDRRQQGRISGGGPGGRDAFEIRQLVNASGEFYQGHAKTLPSFGAGQSRFYRFRLFHNTANNYLATGSSSRTINKLLILGASGSSGSRLILNANGFRNGDFALEIIFDGWSSAPPETAPLAKGVWHSVQLEARWGSGAYIKVWVDSDDYSRPTLVLQGGAFNLTNSPGYTHFGAYSNTGLASGGVHTFRHADFRVATTFDSGWHGSL